MKPTLLHAIRNATIKASLKTAIVAAGLCAAGASHAQSYQFIDLGVGTAAGINDLGQVVGQSNLGATLWNGTSETGLVGGFGGAANAINNAGQIVGSTLNNGVSTAALWSGGTLTSLNGLTGGGNTYATAINNAGQIVGSGLLWNHSINPVQVGTSGSGVYALTAINSSGTIAGSSYAANQSVAATVWQGSKVTQLPGLGTDGYAFAQANAINDAGVVVGNSNDGPRAPNAYALEWNGTTMTQLGSLGGYNSYAMAINNAGQVVGSSDTLNGQSYATIWKGTTAINLDTYLTPGEIAAGWMLTSATGINSKGWIVGDAYNNNTGAQDAFLLEVSPVPEADTWAMLAAGIALIAALAIFKPAPFRSAGGKLAKNSTALA